MDIVEHFESLSSCSIEKESIGPNEPPSKQDEERNHLILGEKVVRVSCQQNYKLKESLTDILDYYRNAI